MSAIWGIIHLDDREADYNQGIKMEQAMNLYKLDRCLTFKKENAVFGCGLQYITEEAINEKLPCYDTKNKLFYTADCMLDNREELVEKLSQLNERMPDLYDHHECRESSIDSKDRKRSEDGKEDRKGSHPLHLDERIPDGTLLYQAYLAWGRRFTDHVLGAFSLVIYDEQKKSCILFTDHTGNRSLYYCIAEQTIYFATVFAPLLAVLPKAYTRLNEKWMVACELDTTPIMEFYPELTPFQEIHQVLPGHSVTVLLNGSRMEINENCYWGFHRSKPLKFRTQEEYRELFIKTLNECVTSVLRSRKNTGITLSSGLDSSSVACVAVKALEGMNQKLYSFTSVPLPEHEEKYDPYYITDETAGVRCICEAYPGIDPEFVSCEGKNACSELKSMVRYLEFPHKSRQNMVWLDEIYERAAIKSCNVVLKGQFGNATISQGKILSRVYDEIKRLHFKTAYHEADMFCEKNKVSRKELSKIFLKELKNKIRYPQKRFEGSMARKELLDKHNITKAVNYMMKVKGSDFLKSNDQRLEAMYDRMAYIQLGALDTRLGLYHGIIIRDPLKDKRIIELCSSFPMKCFVWDGIERAAARKYMRGIVPDVILDTVNRRGLQSADYITRLKTDWDKTRKTMMELLQEPRLSDYIDNDKLKHIREEVQSNRITDSEEELIKALMLCSCAAFLDYIGK